MSEEKDLNKELQDGKKKNMVWVVSFMVIIFAIALVYIGTTSKETKKESNGQIPVVSSDVAENSGEELASKFAEGTHYDVLNTGIDTSGLPEKNVIKYLWLGCEHCQNFHSVINDYKAENESVAVDYRHAANAERWALDARIFFALKQTGNFAYYDGLINFYKKMRVEYQKLPDYNDLSTFLKERNIDPEEFFRVADSELAVEYIEQTINEMRSNNITAVPTIIVNGKYKIKSNLPSDIESQQDYNDLVNYLLNLK